MLARRVLVVDDDTCIHELVAASLEITTDWEVKAFTSAREGLGSAIAEPPDLILLDVCMPEMSGFDFLEALQSTENINKTPVIFLTASSELVKQRSPKHTAQLEVIPKPFNPCNLAKQIADVMNWNDLNDLLDLRIPSFAI
jgi:two-component system, OmpR family, alkaline phosphatase synthesis response regulator PhoP